MIEHAMFEKFAIESVELRWRSKRCLDLFMRSFHATAKKLPHGQILKTADEIPSFPKTFHEVQLSQRIRQAFPR